MGLLLHRNAILRPTASGAAVYNRTPLRFLKAAPIGFPMVLHATMLDNPTHLKSIYSNIMSAGEDLRVFDDAAMTQEMPIQVTGVDTVGETIFVFFRLLTAKSIGEKVWFRTTIGGGETSYLFSNPFGRNNVWQDYNIVVLGSDPNADATGNYTANNQGGVKITVAGNLLNGWPAYGYGTEGTGASDRIEVTAPGDSTTLKDETFIIFRATGGGASARFYEYFIDAGDSTRAGTDDVMAQRKGATTAQKILTTGSVFTGNAWHVVQYQFPTFLSAPSVRVDGASPAATLTAGVGAHTAGSGLFRLMNRNGNDRVMDGRLTGYFQRWDNVPDNAWKDLQWDCFNNPGAIAEAEALVQV